jgi:hypothetical protein
MAAATPLVRDLCGTKAMGQRAGLLTSNSNAGDANCKEFLNGTRDFVILARLKRPADLRTPTAAWGRLSHR